MNTTQRDDLEAIFRAGLAAVDPGEAIRRHVVMDGNALLFDGRRYNLAGISKIILAGAGKASPAMARALEEILGERIADGWINTKYGHSLPLRRARVHECGHPIPDTATVDGAGRITDLLQRAGPDDLVLFCISGGGSALLEMPADGVSLEDIRGTTDALLGSGANIRQMNAVRKHLSAVKGGQLARLAQPAHVVALILSDVIGDPIDVIASGPTAPDPTTFADALDVLRQFRLETRVPATVLECLAEGARGERPETPKPADAVFDLVQNLIIASNASAVSACEACARALGYQPLVLTDRQEGEARDVARHYAVTARKILENKGPVAPPACLIGGGETTVTLRGNGKGGRNQEFALAAALALRDVAGIACLAAGTDGTDGPTDAAGAFSDGSTCARAEAVGLNPEAFLGNNNAYPFFDRLGGLLRTGPTGTNVMDLYLMLAGQKGERS